MHPDRKDNLAAAATAYEDGLHALAFDRYKALADDGHVESQVFVAWMSSHGIGSNANQVNASSYYERAAANGNLPACFYFARWLTRSGDHAKAFRFYARGALKQHAPSMFHVGYSLARGCGVDADLGRSYRYLKAAAMRGHGDALRELGLQDLRGGRGAIWRPIGLLEMAAAAMLALMKPLGNSDSDPLLS